MCWRGRLFSSAQVRVIMIGYHSRRARTSEITGTSDQSKYLTWLQNGPQLARYLAAPHLLAKNVPHTLQDAMAVMFKSARAADKMQQKVFEALISANTASEEPLAPFIGIINDVDDEATPPLEYHYTNFMWYSDQVPGPALENLQGCSCIGSCNSTSNNCSCLMKQHQFWEEGAGSIYDSKGKLLDHDYPIFECNVLCGCGDECINRVGDNNFFLSNTILIELLHFR